MHCFWPVEFSDGRLGASHLCRDSVVFGLVSYLRLRRYPALYSWPNHTTGPSEFTPPLVTSTQALGRPPALLTSTGQKTLHSPILVCLCTCLADNHVAEVET